MRPILRRVALAALLLAPLAASPALAQSPTPENTVITNTATASWTDANGNTYTPVNASVNVTVGFVAGLDVTSPASVTPATSSTGNELTFTITNTGNGPDSVNVSTTAGAGVTVTGYKIGATTYADLAALNAALATTSVTAGGTVQVTVVYSVGAGQAGQTIPVSLTATSRRDGGASDSSTTNVQPPTTAGVAVTPDGGTVSQLPSNGTSYTAQFTITNNGNASDNFNLAASTTNGAVLTIVSVNGTAGASGSLSGLGSGASQTVDVVYTIADGAAAGASAGLQLTATSAFDGGISDAGDLTVTVIRAAVAMTKQAYLDDGTTLVSGNVLPGQYIRYRITVTNNGGASAANVSVSDPLPAQVTYASTSDDGNSSPAWALSESGGTVTGTLTSLGVSESRHFWIRVQVK